MNTTNYEFTDEEADYMIEALQVTTPIRNPFDQLFNSYITTQEEINWLINWLSDKELIIGKITLPSKVVVIHDETKIHVVNVEEGRKMLYSFVDDILG
ncbi:hypothetical protein [Paenibacillus thailandensis]|uniref:Uncharacterized protein n=1 Tax=Paenibacillus thailandensis TaxID=393250 RepID=A0ABW5R424_9BACL